MSKSDFSGDGYDFAAGTIKGIRTWKADDQGRLRGVTYPTVWLPGENVAECRRSEQADCGDPDCDLCRDSKQNQHHFDASCACGFWAYNEYSVKPRGDGIVGVIEGYGRTTIGTKGFRCEKARIVALCRERLTKPDISLSLWLRLQQLYPAADFYDELDDMVTAHDAVLRQWETPGVDFWQPNDQQRSYDGYFMTGGLIHASHQMQAQINRMTQQFTISDPGPQLGRFLP